MLISGYSGIRCLASWTLRGSPSSLLPSSGVHLPVGPGQGRNIGGSGGIPVSPLTSTISTILMRRQSKRGLRASKYDCSVTTSQQQIVNAIGVGLWLVKLVTAS